MIFLSSDQPPLLSAPSLPPSLVLFLALSLLHGDSDTAEMLHLNDIAWVTLQSDAVHRWEVYFVHKGTLAGYNLWKARIVSDSQWALAPHRQWAAVIDVSNAHFQTLLCLYTPDPTDILILMVFLSHCADRCYTRNESTRSETVNPPLHRGARFLFIPLLSWPVCQSFSALLRKSQFYTVLSALTQTQTRALFRVFSKSVKLKHPPQFGFMIHFCCLKEHITNILWMTCCVLMEPSNKVQPVFKQRGFMALICSCIYRFCSFFVENNKKTINDALLWSSMFNFIQHYERRNLENSSVCFSQQFRFQSL